MSIFLQMTPRTRKIPLLNKTQRLASWSSKPWIKRSLAQSWEHTVLKKSQILLEYGPVVFFTTWKTLLMSSIPKSKANSSAAEQGTVPRLELSWKKDDAHLKPRGERAQGPLWSPESVLDIQLLSAPAPALGTSVPRQLPQAVEAQGTHRCHSPAHTLSHGLFSLLLYYWHLRGLFCFPVLHSLFLFHLIAKDCIETLWDHRALCHIPEQATFTKSISLHL